MKIKIFFTVLLLITVSVILMSCEQLEKTRALEENRMKTVTIDFTNCKYMIDLYEEMDRALGFPKGYGKNLSALWDCLTGFVETPVEVHFKGIDSLPKDLQREALEIFEIFVRAERIYGEVHPIID